MANETGIPGRGWWLLGPAPVEALGGPVQELVSGCWLSVAPGLGVTTAESSRARVTLLGYALDPDDAGTTDADTAQRIADRFDGPQSLPVVTARLSGRWAVVVEHESGLWLAADAVGQRRVLFGPGGWCSGSELALHRHAGLPFDPVAMSYTQRYPARGLPVHTTRLSGVRRLLSSEVLDLRSGEPVRVSLTAGVEVPGGEDDALASVARLLGGTMAAAARRSPLLVLLTGGNDSRMLLAGCRDLLDRVRFVTIENDEILGNKADLVTVRGLARSLGLDHVVVPATGTPSRAYAAAAQEHTVAQSPLWAANNEAIARVVPAGAIGVTGNFGELWRGHSAMAVPPGRLPDADWYLGVRSQAGEPLAEGPTRSWFAVADRPDVPIAQRVMWELDFSSRDAAWAEAADQIWTDCLMPHGNRAAVVAVLSLAASWRASNSVLAAEVCRRLWPASTELPLLVNVQHRLPLTQRVQRRARRMLAR